ncbi:MAG: chemotaxis-specific protein-glutamate methyltransferase CheB [Opitutus sp.]
MSEFIRVLIVDDSAFARKVLREILATSTQVDVVGTARDGEEALQMTADLQPDLVLCDLLMPKLDGVGYVRRQMQKRPLPILIVSAAAQDASEVIEALSAGAIDVVRKPTALATDDLRAIRDDLVAKIKAMAHAPVKSWTDEIARPLPRITVKSKRGSVAIVVLGISTGGPQALRRLMPLLPADFPVPMAIVLHMPVGYTALYAEKLNEVCKLEIKEAEEGDIVKAGRVLLAPAGRHLGFRRSPTGEIVARLSMQPLEKIHRPSVDVLFQSAAENFHEGVLAVVMTGMGDDGLEGAAWVKAQGGTVLTESEKSCVIYGMPRSVAEAGLSDAAITLDEMAEAISSRL